MAVWVHFVLLPLLYLVDGKPKLPSAAIRKNATDAAQNNLTDSGVVYHFDYNLFKNKSSLLKPSRVPKKMVRDDIVLDQIEVRFDWNSTLAPGAKHVGALFVLTHQGQTVENALLYPPNDVRLSVRGLKEGLAYRGEVRVFTDPEQLERINATASEEGRYRFVFESPSVIPENDVKAIIEAAKRLPETKVKLDTTSINFKLPKLHEPTVLEIKDMGVDNDTDQVRVSMAPRTLSLVVNDLPSAAVLRVRLSSNGTAVRTAYVFTGSVSASPSPPITRASNQGKHEDRLTVKCFVKDKPPFQGFPCKGSNICIPLHWECDGEEDCVGGFDESRCENSKKPASTTASPPPPHKCKKNEFPCVSKSVPVCLPSSWLCDGRTDCSDGWDESAENCEDPEKVNVTGFSYCDKNHFKCHRGGCVAKRKECDGYNDCSDGSDEYDCVDDDDEDEDEDEEEDDFFCDPNYEFKCNKRSSKTKCIPRPWVCDDQDDCPFGEDETDNVCRSHYHNYFDKKRQA